MKYNMYLDIKGPSSTVRDIPNTHNPVDISVLNLPKEVFGTDVEYLKVVFKSVYEVWSEGYRSSDGEADATFHGYFEAESWREALEKFKDSLDEESKKDVNVNRMTFWGCRLFDNETDARESFG